MPEHATLDPTLLAYDLAVLAPDGRLLHLPRGALTIEESEGELATIMRCHLPDVMTTEGHMATLVRPGTPYYVRVAERGPTGPRLRSPTTSWGAGWDPETGGTVGGVIAGGELQEITRGTIQRISRRTDSIELEVEGSDNLATLLDHDVDLSVAAGTPAREVLEELFASWGATLGEFAGPDIELPEKTWRGERAAAVIDDILEQAPRQGAGRYLLRARGDVFDIIAAGENDPTYWLRPAEGAGVSSYTIDISQMVGQVVVQGQVAEDEATEDETDDEDRGERAPRGQRLSAEGALEFGGATRIIVPDERSTAEISSLEAEAALAEYGFPDETFGHITFDLPYLHKWDRVRISDSVLDGYFFVAGVSHDASAATMQLTLITPEDFERQAHLLQLQAQLDRLKGEQQAASAASGTGGAPSAAATGGDAVARIRAIAAPVMGRTYESPGTLGRSVFDPNPPAGVNGDCSGFVAWVARQLGCSLPSFTDSIAAATELVSTNSIGSAVAGDLILQWDNGATQAGAAYPHVQMYLQGSTVVESGGSSGSGTGRSQIWEGPILTNYPRWEVRRSQCIYQALHGGAR